jgi:hypothetical protein
MAAMNHLVALLALCSGCFFNQTIDDAPPDPPDVPVGCIPNADRERQTVVVSGQVLDFVTATPVAGATVDVTTAWDVTGNFPHAECPLLATLVSDANGRFGPVSVKAGSIQQPSILVFLVHGGDRAQTASDARICAEPMCNVGHTIGAPTAALMATIRGELGAGGMTDAATRGLVAFRYKNPDGSNAADVTPALGLEAAVDLVPGTEVRFLDTDRRTVMPRTQATTTGSGMAIVGMDDPSKAIYVGGKRTTQKWTGVGCLVEPGWLFLEDKTGSP